MNIAGPYKKFTIANNQSMNDSWGTVSQVFLEYKKMEQAHGKNNMTYNGEGTASSSNINLVCPVVLI